MNDHEYKRKRDTYLVTGLEKFGQDSVQELKLSGCPHDLLIDSISRRSEILVDLGENIGVITDFPQLHQSVLQRGRFSWFTTSSAYALPEEKRAYPAVISIGSVLYFCTLSYNFHCKDDILV